MNHDRIHARKPSQDTERWSTGEIESLERRDGHCVVTVRTETDGTDRVELVVTFAVRDLFVSRLDIDEDESPVGQQIWYRKRGN
ncbi:MAG: hypothetical protein V5A55_04265 [Halovenus sp.]